MANHSWAWGEYYSKTKVTVSELKQILFREHVKNGDVFIGRNGDIYFVCVYDRLEQCHYRVSNWRSLTEDYFYSNERNNPGYIDKFIRYATEEEKALLNPVKELEVGKWYIVDKDSPVLGGYATKNGILCYRGNDSSFGFNMHGVWYNDFRLNDSYPVIREATEEEVEQALVKEAGKRYGKDWKTVKIKEHADGSMGNVNFGGFANNVSLNYVWNKNGMLFHNGKWAEVMGDETDVKPSIVDNDIAIIERLHDQLLDAHGYQLSFKPLEEARQLAEKLRKLL